MVALSRHCYIDVPLFSLLGALLVRADSARVLKKRYFGGGTVQVSVSKERFHIDKDNVSDR